MIKLPHLLYMYCIFMPHKSHHLPHFSRIRDGKLQHIPSDDLYRLQRLLPPAVIFVSGHKLTALLQKDTDTCQIVFHAVGRLDDPDILRRVHYQLPAFLHLSLQCLLPLFRPEVEVYQIIVDLPCLIRVERFCMEQSTFFGP